MKKKHSTVVKDRHIAADVVLGMGVFRDTKGVKASRDVRVVIGNPGLTFHLTRSEVVSLIDKLTSILLS